MPLLFCGQHTFQDTTGFFVEELRYESNALYLEAIRSLQAKGIHIQSITCDGRRGLEKLSPTFPRSYVSFTKCRSSNDISPVAAKALRHAS